MTCLEKYRQENPNDSRTDDRVIADICPDMFSVNIMDEPDWCHMGSCSDANDDSCTRCWNRQIPGTESAEPHIRDSGSRTEFSTGAVRDIQKGKGRCDLMPLNVVAECFALHIGGAMPTAQIFRNLNLFTESGNWEQLVYVLVEFCEDRKWNIPTMVLEVSKHFEEGAEKYGEGNWQKGLPVKCYINSGVRHYLKWLRGDTDEFHDRAFCWNIMCAIWTCCHKPELNDYATTKKPTFDPDDFIGEYEEENE